MSFARLLELCHGVTNRPHGWAANDNCRASEEDDRPEEESTTKKLMQQLDHPNKQKRIENGKKKDDGQCW